MHQPVARIVLHPVGEEGEARLALAELVEQVAADVRGVRALRIGGQRRARCCARPRRTGRARSARRRAGCGTTSRRHNASRTARAWRAAPSRGRPCREKPIRPNTLVAGAKRHGVARPALRCARWIAASAASPWPVRILSKIAMWLCSRGVVPAASSSARARGALASWPRPISCLARASEMWASAKPSSAATASAKAVSVPARGGHQAVDAAHIGVARRRRASC